jgi:peptide-methionine (R)-S-oxide reductase
MRETMLDQNEFSIEGPAQGKTGRRVFLAGLGALAVGILGHKLSAASPSAPGSPAEVSIEIFSAAGKRAGVVRLAKVVKTEAEWRAQLSPLAYNVARQEGTEVPYTGEYAGNHADGLYRCVCCNTALFDSKTKYDSGTGWPSFWQAISRLNVVNRLDSSLGMQRDAISCCLCDAHLGHVFDDGPRPTGLRYCMNSVALHFVARA